MILYGQRKKGGSNGIASQYRPVALTSHIIKLFEKIVRKNIVGFMEENDLFNSTQHGFRIGRSCLRPTYITL